MDDHPFLKINLAVLAACFAGLFLLAGCKGNTGPAGPPGTPATFGQQSCTDCHHLNNTLITPANDLFIDGLAGGDKTVSAGSSTTFSPNLSKLPAGETPIGYLWQQTGGLPISISSPAASTVTVMMQTQPTGSYGYKQTLIDNVPSAGVITDETGSVIRDSTLIVPVSNDSLGLASSAELKLTVYTNAGKSYFDLVSLFDKSAQSYLAGIAAVNTGLQTVPINVPVLLKAKTAAAYDWTVTGPTTTVTDPDRQIASFIPVSEGTYTVSVNGTSFPVFAGRWRGVAVGTNANNDPQPDPVCLECHNNSAAVDNFTPWSTSGHAHIFSKTLNAGGHNGPACFQCHTVGFNTNPLAVNNGFDDQPNYASFITNTSFFSTDPDNSRYQRMWSAYPALAQETNVQCENCHGPQLGDGDFIASHRSTTNVSLGSPRTSMAADVCGSCHGEPLRHSRFQQWQTSGHGQYDLAIGEGTLEENPIASGCAGCHTAQGFLIYLRQLLSGKPLRTLPPGSVTWTTDTVQPVTCAVCHDPHAEGMSSGDPNTATVRVSGDTPKLPGGFAATGVGRGAMCIVCHNSRNGTPSSSNEPLKNVAPFNTDSFLHQDADPVFGHLTAYASPHEACQGDVLLGKNAYFTGNISAQTGTGTQSAPTGTTQSGPTGTTGLHGAIDALRSPHSFITDTCANCHMEKTPPPPLLSYNLSGTNHTFQASLEICFTCHGVNEGLAVMLQDKVTDLLANLQKSISAAIVSHYTGTAIPIDKDNGIVDLGSRGTINIISNGTPTTLNLNNAPGVMVSDLGTDVLAKALWNYYLISLDSSFGIHNPDFTLLVIGQSKFAADNLREP